MKLADLFLLLAVPLLGAPAAGQDPFGEPVERVLVHHVWSQDAARPGDLVVLAVVADIDDGWHINASRAQLASSGDTDQLPTVVRVVKAPTDVVTPETVSYPEPHLVEFAGVEVLCYEKQAVFYIPVKVHANAVPGEEIRLLVETYFQACDDKICLDPQTRETDARLAVVEPGTEVRALHPELFADLGNRTETVGFDLFGLRFSVDASSWSGLLLLLLVAALGGALLNFTPCVLPVIPIKIISLSKVAGHRSRCLALGVAMSLGVIGFWLGLGILISAASGFTATNQLFQYPAFTISVGIVIAALAVGMCGLFSVRLPGFVYNVTPRQDTLSGSFGLGIMTAILSTPCTAPFMGAAAAWAAGQTAPTTLATFIAIGAGMALPYLVLSAFPRLVSAVPRSGPASQLIKEVMGLFLLAAAAYFIGTGLSGLLVTPPDPPSRLHWWPVMGLAAAAGIWTAWRTFRISRSPVRRTVFGALGLAVVLASGSGGVSLTGKGPIDWVYYTEARFEEAMQAGKVVLMDFTAEWCLNCKALEHSVLYSDEVAKLIAQEHVVPIKVDITGNYPEGKRMLSDAGSLTIPLLVIWGPGREQLFKSDAYTISQVVDALERALIKSASAGRPSRGSPPR